jgi:hypothetical protein
VTDDKPIAEVVPKEPHWWDAPAAAFYAWCADHDPDGEMDLLDQIDAYAKWTGFDPPSIIPTRSPAP